MCSEHTMPAFIAKQKLFIKLHTNYYTCFPVFSKSPNCRAESIIIQRNEPSLTSVCSNSSLVNAFKIF